MSERIQFSKEFYDRYVSEQPKRIDDLLTTRPPKKGALEELSNIFPEASRKEIKNSIESEEFKLDLRLAKIIAPWAKAGLEIPRFTVLEVSRRTGQSPTEILKLLDSMDSINVYGKSFRVVVETPKLERSKRIKETIWRRNSKGNEYTEIKARTEYIRYPLLTARGLRLNPKGIIKLARNVKFRDGSASVDRSRLDNGKTSEIIQILAIEKAILSFVEVKNNRVSTVPKEIKQLRKVELESVTEALDWFKQRGSRKNWVLGKREDLLAQRLTQLANGERVDSLLWNCIGFQWTQGKPGEMPKCTIINNSAEFLAVYYKSKIVEIAGQQAKLGKTTITVLVPSNEAFNLSYERLGVYTQNREERNKVLDEIVRDLQTDLSDIVLPDGIKLEVLRWDGYLEKLGITTPQEEFSEKGIVLLSSENRQEMIKSGRARFKAYNIQMTDEQIIALNSAYYGMYAGEGIALKQEKVVILNLEEMRVAQLEFLGANGELAIVTPIKPKEMKAFYDWKNSLKTKRYEK